MVVQHNLRAMNSNRMLGITTGQQTKSSEKLSSGYKINRAADDAAGLAISEKMRKQIRGLTQASANAQDGISAVQTAEGALTEVHDMLQRMNELAVKSSNGTNSESDRQAIQDEVDQLVTEIDRVSTTTKFNETYLLKGVDTNGESKLTFNTAKTGFTALGNLTFDEDGTATTAAASIAANSTYNYSTGTATSDTVNYVFSSASNNFSAAIGGQNYSLFRGADDEKIKAAFTATSVHVFSNEEDFLNAVKSAVRDNDTAGNVKSLSLDGNTWSVSAFADVNNDQTLDLQVGADTTKANKIDFTVAQMSARGLGVNGLRVDGKDSTNADKAVDTIAKAIQTVSSQRSALGAVQNRLEHTINNLDNVVENTTSAESQIRDTDMATEMVKFSNNNILAQAGQAMLAQSNQANQGVLSLLQ